MNRTVKYTNSYVISGQSGYLVQILDRLNERNTLKNFSKLPLHSLVLVQHPWNLIGPIIKNYYFWKNAFSDYWYFYVFLSFTCYTSISRKMLPREINIQPFFSQLRHKLCSFRSISS